MNKKIKSLMRVFINNQVIVNSWGITEIGIHEEYLMFKVDGLKYKGMISIQAEKDDYIIRLNSSNTIKESSPDKVVDYLDSIIEKSDNYISDVLNWIGQIKK